MSIDKKKIKRFIGISVAAIGVAFIGMSILAKKKKASSVYEDDKEQKNPFEGKKVVLIEDENDKENADGVRGHLEATGDSEYNPSFYEKHIKRAIDVVLSFGGLVILFPVFAAIALAIKIEDPGPVLFTQKRVGQNKKYFKLHKFRSMKMFTPHDVPTHQLENPDQYITKVGKFIRKHSLDELPQIWDIFVGNMSVIGPRPALWNQDVLIAERDKYGANDVRPGLTGWAQINGRDELEIPDKAKIDGEYVKKMGFLMDIKCFLGSLHVFGKDESLVEGGTREMKKFDMSENEKPKILFVANVDKEHICKFHIPTIRYFKSQGWQVDVACSGNTEVPECDHRYYGKWKRSPFRFGTISGTLQLWKILKENKYDVIYCHTPVGGFVARVAAIGLKNKPKVVYFAHGFHFFKGGPKVMWLTIYPIEKLLSHFTDLIITLNKEDYELAMRKLATHAKIIQSPGIGVDFSRLSLSDKESIRTQYRKDFGVEDKTVLIYIAELIENKNQKMLIDVVKKISEKRNDVVLLLVGSDHADGAYQKYAKETDVDDKVIFTGWRSDIGALLAMSDICVASSVREGFGINLVEAMYVGLPVVAVANRGHKTIIEDGKNGFLVPLNDVETMSNRILQIMKDPYIKAKFSNLDIAKYDANIIAKNLYTEINAIL